MGLFEGFVRGWTTFDVRVCSFSIDYSPWPKSACVWKTREDINDLILDAECMSHELSRLTQLHLCLWESMKLPKKSTLHVSETGAH